MTNHIIAESLNNAIDYEAYRNLVEKLVACNSTTGHEKTEALAIYTVLNSKRMRRWDKTVKLSEPAKIKIKKFDKKVTWLVITESWCGDAAHIMPVINKVAELNENISYKIVLRDDNDSLMEQFLTNGSKSIPKLIALNSQTNEVLNTFGPRPQVASQLVLDYKSKHGELTPQFKEDLQRWYNKDKGQSTINDLLRLLD